MADVLEDSLVCHALPTLQVLLFQNAAGIDFLHKALWGQGKHIV